MSTLSVDATVTRLDLLRTTAGLPRWQPATTGIIWLLISAYYFHYQMTSTGYEWTVRSVFVAVFVGMFMAAAFFLFAIAVATLSVQISASYKAGILGRHQYTLAPDGFSESTVANDTLSRWPSVKSAWRTRHYIFVRILPCRIHVVPAQAFPDKAAADIFWSELRRYIGQSG